jgi:TM2 domain-containing membrane protein YozV
MRVSSPKSRLVFVLLTCFLGIFGAHRFYAGRTGTAAAMLILGVLGWAAVWVTADPFFLVVSGIWALADLIKGLAGSFRDGSGKSITDWAA